MLKKSCGYEGFKHWSYYLEWFNDSNNYDVSYSNDHARRIVQEPNDQKVLDSAFIKNLINRNGWMLVKAKNLINKI